MKEFDSFINSYGILRHYEAGFHVGKMTTGPPIKQKKFIPGKERADISDATRLQLSEIIPDSLVNTIYCISNNE